MYNICIQENNRKLLYRQNKINFYPKLQCVTEFIFIDKIK